MKSWNAAEMGPLPQLNEKSERTLVHNVPGLYANVQSLGNKVQKAGIISFNGDL